MRHPPFRRIRPAAVGATVVAAEMVIRLAVGEPYIGSVGLLVLACGVSMLPFLPSELVRPSLRLAMVPALGIVSFGTLLTTISIVGAPLTGLSIRLAVTGLVLGLGALACVAPALDDESLRLRDSRELLVIGAVLVVFAFALVSGWDVVGPFPPGGSDWGHYLLYADEVERQGELLASDPYADESGRLFADSPGVGALYGGARMTDGLPSSWLSYGIIVVSALSTLSVFAAAGALWGVRAGLVAAAAWAVAPIHIDPIRWHGVGTNLALVFVPLVLLALGLLYRERRGWRPIVLLGTSLLGVAVSHSTSAFVVAFVVVAAVAVDAGYRAVKHRADPRCALRAWWKEGIVRPVLMSVAFACLVGAGVVVHLRHQAVDLGRPISYRLFEPDWLTWNVVADSYSIAFLALTAVSVAIVLANRAARRDPALLALVVLTAACVVVGQLWLLHVPFEYRRAIFYLGIGMVMLIGVASTRMGLGAWGVVGYVVALAYVAHVSIGARLPERVLSGAGEPNGLAAQSVMHFSDKLRREGIADVELVVTDRCHNYVVPYFLRRPTMIAFEPWQVGFEERVPSAERAATVLRGGSAGLRLARSLGVRYVVVNPVCTPGLPDRLGGTVVEDSEHLVVLDLRRSAQASAG